jgi:Zn-dependent protease
MDPTTVVGTCSQCGTAIPASHPYSWCSACGTSLPVAVQQRLENAYVQSAAADPTRSMSILRDNVVTAREVEAELRGASSPKATLLRSGAVLIGSLLLFMLLEALQASLVGILIVVGVLFVHELGHFLAMKLFRYRDVQMFFIPLFGAAVSGTDTRPSPVKQATVSLAGPVPGVALGMMCAMAFHATSREIWQETARVFLLLNTFNLLPFVPLDGGRYVDAVLFSRAPRLRVAFQIVAGVALAALAFALQSIVLGIVGFFVLASARLTYFTSRLARDLQKELAARGASSADAIAHCVEQDHIPTDYIERLIPLLWNRLPENGQNAKTVASVIRSIWTMACSKPPTVAVTVGLLVLYAVCFTLSVLITLVVEASFSTASPTS